MNETTITLKNEHGEYTITINKGGISIGSVIEDLVIPLLLAAGYAKETIDRYIDCE
jgi:hypothetical protein